MKPLLKRLFVAGGGAGRIRNSNKSVFRILMYHRFTGDEAVLRRQLTWQCARLRKNFQPVSVAQAAEALAGRRPLPENGLAVTVDDGYRDFASAWPVFREYGIPVTLYVVSGFLQRSLWLWPDVLRYCLREATRPLSEIAMPDGSRFQGPASKAFSRIAKALIQSPDAERRHYLAQLPHVTGVALPNGIPDEFAPLSWPQLKAMAHDGLDVGAHTQSHPILSRLASLDQKRAEILGSKLAIEREIGMPVLNFCYPNGKPADFDAECVQSVQEAGFASAVTAMRGWNAPGASRWTLKRIGADPAQDFASFELETAGFRMR